jgi:uncharacterized protein
MQQGGTASEEQVARLIESARENNASFPFNLTLARLHADLVRTSGASKYFPHMFVCDAGLGGLARWLRGAGYESHWNPALDDAAVIREAQQRSATLITTDSLMIERGVLRDGIVPTVFVPSTLTCEQQLEIVFRELGLSVRDSRCMNCGGELRRVEKSAVADRIPPRTARWIDEYFVCANCDHLFWRGTHWQRIRKQLETLL